MEGVGEEAPIGGLWSSLKLDNEYIIRFRPANWIGFQQISVQQRQQQLKDEIEHVGDGHGGQAIEPKTSPAGVSQVMGKNAWEK